MAHPYKFNEAISQIMHALIDSCPEPTGISTNGRELVKGKWVEADSRASEKEEYLLHCAEWLKQEGLIRGSNPYVVTFKGLELFNALPAALKSK